MLKETDSFMNRVRRALALPIRTRCAELTVLFDRGSTLDLQNFFPLLVDSIFGPNGSLSWGLRTPTAVNEDFNQLEHFLSPGGPVFKLIYTLLKDPSAKYDFSLSYLPAKVQQTLENAQNHPFYGDLLHINPQTKHIISLLLNPFDYYMFHFTYHLINPWHQRSGNVVSPSGSSWNTVYYVLSCEYMLHFLPTNPSKPVTPAIFYNGKSPLQNLQPLQQLNHSVLIPQRMMNKVMHDDYSFANTSRHPRNEVWRSETVLTLFIDMWLTTDQIGQNSSQFNSSFNQSIGLPRVLQYCELPTSEYMRIVRVLVKQIHAFTASAKIDDTYMRDLKKIALPMLEGKFYIFLRHIIHKWPLDGSFRLVLELWLTYLQPWRYATSAPPPDESGVDRAHLPFIAQNLLCYVVILQQLLPRFARVDLVSPKMSVMLFRISKVFAQSQLAHRIEEAERGVAQAHSPAHAFAAHWPGALPPLHPTSSWSSSAPGDAPAKQAPAPPGDRQWAAVVKQRIYELEGPSFCYRPLFTARPAQEVLELVRQVRRAVRVAQELVQIKEMEEREMYTTFGGLVRAFFSSEPRTNDEFSLAERLKVPEYLNKALENLMEVFRIEEVQGSDLEMERETSISSANCTNGTMEMSGDFRFLTPDKVRERAKRIRYEGDPDLHPIRSSEITFLVRMLYQISQNVNEKFQAKICQVYYDASFWGRLSRQFLAPPITIYKYDKTRPGSPRIGTNLPPRVSLRYFSTYRFLSYFLIGAALFLLSGFNMTIYFIFIIGACIIFKVFKAFTSSSTVGHNYPTQGFGNISFDDSF